jgi:hypothetical protein
MSKQNSTLESLLAAFNKTEALRADTEALKPRLETEINGVLASGDVLDEKTALSLQTKRGQLDLIPAKLEQISTRRRELEAEIEIEFNKRYMSFRANIRLETDNVRRKVLATIQPLMFEPMAAATFADMICPRTKLAIEFDGLTSPIDFQITVIQNTITASRELLKREKELAQIKARPENLMAGTNA